MKNTMTSPETQVSIPDVKKDRLRYTKNKLSSKQISINFFNLSSFV